MAGLDLPRVTVTIRNHFEGPNFVNGLAKQSDEYTVLSDTRARLEFKGGFNDEITYVQILQGTGFGVDEDGRFTGNVDGYRAFEKGEPENGWSFAGLGVPLDRLNNLVSDPGVTFQDLLLIPLVYNFVGAEFDDIYICGSFDDICRGFAGNDTFEGLSGDDTLIGGGNADTLTGEDGEDRLLGGDGRDVLDGGRGGDALFGGRSNDTVRGGEDSDLVQGGDGDDLLDGGSGADTVAGGTGADTIAGGGGADSLLGGDGGDSIDGDSGGDTIRGGDGDDTIDAGDGTNFVYGNAGDDRIAGSTGTDELFGGTGDDVVVASTGADFVLGGAGDDTLSANTVGSGAGDKATDSFIFDPGFGRDVVTDFEVGFDNIVLRGIDEDDVTVTTAGDDVRISVAGGARILVEGVAADFDAGVDILFG